jgi:hypothetical protein
MWSLLILLAGAPMPTPITWFPDKPACERGAELALASHAREGKRVETVLCQAIAMPRLRPVTGEVLAR